MTIISLSITDELVAGLNSFARKAGFSSRSEVIRYAIRSFLAEKMTEVRTLDSVIGTITALYDKLAEKQSLSKLQHDYESVIKTLLHVHLDEKNCLEVMVVEGRGSEIVDLLNGLRTLKGMKQAKLIATTSL